MEQRDYLQKQIDQLGRALGKLLADLIGLKNQGEVSEGIEITSQKLKDELDLDLESLINMPTDEFLPSLQLKKNFNKEGLEKLADILLIIADETYIKQEKEKSKGFYFKSLNIYEHLEKTETTYSFERHYKIERIKMILFTE